MNRGATRSKLRLCAASLRLLGSLDLSRLQSAIEIIAHRHESLRTRIAGPPDAPRQLIDTPTLLASPVVDFSNSEYKENLARKAAEEFISEEIDLAVGPLFAARVFRLSRQDHVLVVGIDHFVSDAVSCSILTREILAVYGARTESEHHCLPRLSVQFPDFAVWQAGTYEEWIRRHAAYWRNRLSTTEKFRLPLDNERPSNGYPNREFLHIPFGKVVSAALADIGRRRGTLMPLLVLSIQLIIMSEWCQRRALLVEFYSHGRNGSPLLKNMVGFLAYPMYLSIEVVPTETFEDLLQRVSDEYYSALEHDASRTIGNLVTSPPTELVFNWVPAAPRRDPLALESDICAQHFPITKSATALFAPHYYPTPSGVVAEVWYGRGLFENRTLQSLENAFRSVPKEVAEHPEVLVGSLRSLCAR